MANTRSALKAHRVSERRHARNRSVRSAVRTYVKKARLSLQASVGDEANAAVAQAAKMLDSAASKGVIHKNQAARRKSRLMRQLAVMVKSAAVAEATVEAAPRRARRSTTAGGTRGATPRRATTRTTTSTARTTRATTSRARTTKPADST